MYPYAVNPNAPIVDLDDVKGLNFVTSTNGETYLEVSFKKSNLFQKIIATRTELEAMHAAMLSRLHNQVAESKQQDVTQKDIVELRTKVHVSREDINTLSDRVRELDVTCACKTDSSYTDQLERAIHTTQKKLEDLQTKVTALDEYAAAKNMDTTRITQQINDIVDGDATWRTNVMCEIDNRTNRFVDEIDNLKKEILAHDQWLDKLSQPKDESSNWGKGLENHPVDCIAHSTPPISPKETGAVSPKNVQVIADYGNPLRGIRVTKSDNLWSVVFTCKEELDAAYQIAMALELGIN